MVKFKIVSILALLAMLLPVAGIAEAQELVVQYYLVPVLRVGYAYGPQYIKWRFNPEGLDVEGYWVHYGGPASPMLLTVINAEQTDQDWLAAQEGVYAFPVDLDTNPSPAQISELTTVMEASYIPADWLTPSMTWREVIRTIYGTMKLAGKMFALTGVPFLELGIALNTQFRNVDPELQATIHLAYDELGYDKSVIRDNWTMRIILKNSADQFGDQPVNIGGFATL